LLTIFPFNARLDLDESDPILSDNMSLRINGSGHVIHAFVNGEHIGNIISNMLLIFVNHSFCHNLIE